MSYSSFTNLELKRQFGVEQVFQMNLFTNIAARPASELLKTVLSENLNFALAQGTEKARSEYIIAPVFSELRKQSHETISIFSGWELNVDVAKGLIGFCDFLISRSPYQSALEAPIVVAVEAKKEDFEKGISQCERLGNPTDEMYGCVTTGDVWRFLVLRGDKAFVETVSFDVQEDLERILGILWAMTFDEIVR
jgi:hypothetical protein